MGGWIFISNWRGLPLPMAKPIFDHTGWGIDPP